MKLKECLDDLDDTINYLLSEMKTLKIKLEIYDDIDSVIEKVETKVSDMRHREKVLHKVQNDIFYGQV